MKINRLEIIFISSVAVALVFLFAFFLPAVSRIRQLRSEVSQGISLNETSQTDCKTYTIMHDTLQKAEKELDRYRKMLPDSSERLDVLRKFEKVGQKSGQTNIVSLKMLNTSEMMDGQLERQLFEVMLNGEYKDIAQFIFGLTHMDIKVTIEKMVISSIDNGNLRAKIVVACYFSEPPAEVAQAGISNKEGWR